MSVSLSSKSSKNFSENSKKTKMSDVTVTADMFSSVLGSLLRTESQQKFLIDIFNGKGGAKCQSRR